jgi:hypothetical protein
MTSVVGKPVDHGDQVVAEHFTPSTWLVAGDNEAGAFVAGGDELHEQARRLDFGCSRPRRGWQRDAVEFAGLVLQPSPA